MIQSYNYLKLTIILIYHSSRQKVFNGKEWKKMRTLCTLVGDCILFGNFFSGMNGLKQLGGSPV